MQNNWRFFFMTHLTVVRGLLCFALLFFFFGGGGVAFRWGGGGALVRLPSKAVHPLIRHFIY